MSSSTEEEVIRPTTVSSTSYHMCSTATVLNSATNRSRRKEKTAKPKCQCPLERSPPVPRKILQVATATIDMPTTDIGRNRDGDVGTTSPERESGNESSPGRHQVRSKTSPSGKAGDKIDMPPELIVTPAHHRKGSKPRKKTELEVPGSNLDRTSPYPASPSQKSSKSWHATRHRRKRYAKSHRQKGLLRPHTGIPTEDSCVTCEVCLECSVRLSNICSSDDKIQEKQQIFKCTCRNISVLCQDARGGSSKSQIDEYERTTTTSTTTRIVDGKRKKRNTIGEVRRTHRRSASMITSHTSTSLEDTETTDSTRIQWRRGKPRLRRQFGEEVSDQQEGMTRLRVELQSNKHSKKQTEEASSGNLQASSNPEKTRRTHTRKSLNAKDISDSTTFRSSTESRSRETGLIGNLLDDYEFTQRPTTRKKKRKSHVANQLLV